MPPPHGAVGDGIGEDAFICKEVASSAPGGQSARLFTMLVLSRQIGEWLVIGDADSDDAIVVKVVSINGSNVRLGIDAPRTMRVLRASHLAGTPPEDLSERVRKHKEVK